MDIYFTKGGARRVDVFLAVGIGGWGDIFNFFGQKY